MMKRLGLVTNQFPVVSETFIVNKALGLVKAGLNVTVCVTTNTADKEFYSHNQDIKSVKIVNLNNNFKIIISILRHPIEAISWFNKIWRKVGFVNGISMFLKGFLLKLQRFDIIHFEFSGIGVAYLDLFEILKPCNIYVSCRGTAEYVTPLVDSRRKADLVSLFSKVDRIHCVSEAISLEIMKYGASSDKIFINRPATYLVPEPNFIQVAKKEASSYILSVGRLTFQKGYIYALIAIKHLVSDYPDLEYHIVGAGDDLAELRFFIETNNLQKNVFLHGAVSSEEVRRYMSNSDILLLSSVYEGIANVSLEAMALSVPIVSTNAGGMGEVIIDEYNGILVDCFNPYAIVKGLEKVLKNKNLRDRICENARNTIISSYTMVRQIEIYLKEYN